MKITIFYIVVFFLFATISTHASAQKTKPSQPTKLSSIPVFRVNPVTDTATKISFKNIIVF